MTGSWMQMMAQGWVMTTLTTSAVMLGLVNFATSIPMLVLALKGGVLADRLNKRNILLMAQVAQIGFALLVGWLVASQRVQVWHIIAVAFLLGIVFAFEMPAVNALVPELVRREQIPSAKAGYVRIYSTDISETLDRVVSDLFPEQEFPKPG